jgi:putative solute:sodium symporter small subunit
MPEPAPAPLPDPVPAAAARQAAARYWRRVVALTCGLLLIWAALGLGAGVWFAAALAPYRLGGFPLGFWFAQQGAILGFVLLILVYALAMAAFDRAYRRELLRAPVPEARR